jgi:LmbE family N-acetylglucosaminyl deacetylase
MTNPRRRTVVAVSPHLDDVAFSCGGVLGVLRRAGWHVRVATVFTATVTPLSQFALACQLDKGLDVDVDYMALRRAEDAEAMRCLGVVDTRHLDLPEAPHRGYGSAPELFAGRRPDDGVGTAVGEVLAPLVAGADVVLGPQGLGGHVDHLVVRDALLALDLPLLVYRDTPYATRLSVSGHEPDEVAVDIGVALGDKLAACAAYASQLGFQFGGPDGMATVLRAFAAFEAARCGATGAAEVLAGAAEMRDRLP